MSFDFRVQSSSLRPLVFGKNMVASSQPLAVSSALKTLWKGGNAVDAALSAAMTLTVVEPTMNGISGDAFAMVWDGGKLHGLNSSGKSPSTWTPERFSGLKSMPLRGWESVTVPGQVAGWVELNNKFGRLDFETLCHDACAAAREGFHVTPATAALWENVPADLKAVPGFLSAFFPSGKAPRCGEVFRYPEQADVLEEIARTKGNSFYNGRIASLIAEDALRNKSALTVNDLASHRADWVTPLTVRYGGLDVHEMPPNSQGLSTLMALGLFSNMRKKGIEFWTLEYIHLQLECMKLALADAESYLSDVDFFPCDPKDYLTTSYWDERIKLIDSSRAKIHARGIPPGGGTVLVTVGDSEGMIVSFIQSNWWGFGSGVIVPGTGISLHNRASSFNLEKGHPNEVGGSKRPFHTLIPGFLTKDGQPLAAFGLMGGTMQAQGHFQLVCRMEDGSENPQTAFDAPRWRIIKGLDVLLEEGFSEEIAFGLQAKGHNVLWRKSIDFGGAQMVYRIENGYMGASDHRKDGHAAGF
jgi:gamma-glutamyltranspeptidase/glutathione hydrolase